MREKIKRIVKSRMCAQAETVNSFILILVASISLSLSLTVLVLKCFSSDNRLVKWLMFLTFYKMLVSFSLWFLPFVWCMFTSQMLTAAIVLLYNTLHSPCLQPGFFLVFPWQNVPEQISFVHCLCHQERSFLDSVKTQKYCCKLIGPQ